MLFCSQYVLCSFFVSHVEKFGLHFMNHSCHIIYESDWNLIGNFQVVAYSEKCSSWNLHFLHTYYLCYLTLARFCYLPIIFTSIIFYTLSLKLSLLAVNGSFLKSKQYVDNGCLMARKICWKKVLLSWSSQRPLKKKKNVNGVLCQTWRLALHKWFGRIFFFFFEREREF